MGKEWDYSKLSQAAKQNGGPERYLKLLKEYSRREGVLEGRKEGRTEVLMSEGIALGLGFLGYAGYKAYATVKERREKEALNKQQAEVKDAETKLVEEMKASLETEGNNTDTREDEAESDQ